MKSSIFTALAFLLYTTGFTQVEDQFSIGPRIGINIASASNVEESKSLVGLAAGLTSTYSFSEKSGVTLDLLYSGEGFAHEFSDSKVKLGYILLPIYFDLFFGELGQALRPKVYAGIAPAFLISAKYSVNQNDLDVRLDYADFNFSFTAGAGINYRLSDRVWLNGDVRAFIGITDLRHKSLLEGDTVASRNVQVSAGVAYGLSKI
ncbi:MAG TPA: porin family protein [Saprospiraceae bacterium]|nr:porin family protein [Saprospiraceae bacterium]